MGLTCALEMVLCMKVRPGLPLFTFLQHFGIAGVLACM